MKYKNTAIRVSQKDLKQIINISHISRPKTIMTTMFNKSDIKKKKRKKRKKIFKQAPASTSPESYPASAARHPASPPAPRDLSPARGGSRRAFRVGVRF